MLNRMLTPADLFGVATPRMTPRDLVLGRQTLTIEDQLARNWTWGKTDGVISFEDDEEGLVRCYGEKVALEIVPRLREEKTLISLSGFVRHLGNLREARKVIVLFTGGWPLYLPNEARMHQLLTGENYGKQTVGIGPGGRLTMAQPNNPGMAEWDACAAQLSRAFQLDNRRRFFQLIDEANRANVSFYPVSMNGLVVGQREDMFHELADNTDGLPVVTNDLSAGLKRVTDDVSAFYLLGYYSTNAQSDGRYHRIEVKPLARDLQVKARRGYMSAATAESAPAAFAKAAPPEGVTAALDVLARLRPGAELFTYGAVMPNGLRLVVELPASHGPTPEWDRGAGVQFSLAGDEATAPVTGRIEPGSRAVALTAPRPAGDGPYRFSVRVAASKTVVNDRLEVAPSAAKLIGDPVLFRAAQSPRAPTKPVANFQFWRTERIVVDWPRLATLERREARLLGRDGRPLPVPVGLTEREVDGVPVLTANLNLAPLAPGDYVIELTAASAGDSVTRYVGIRVLR
jgi:hypothetical protein